MGQFGSKLVKCIVYVFLAFRGQGSKIGNEHLLVQVEQGKLRGKEGKSALQKRYCCFLGIPYAKPPLGELRFMPPEDPEPWQGEYDATYERSDCRHKDLFLNFIVGSEDCLYLNVYTPKPPIQMDKPLPVMVFIHGGGFIFGSGSRKLYGGDLMMNQDVILVTFNYRLHILGFLNLGIEECPGNVGLKDQVCALKWVQRNIRNFGGDPQNVTIFGESAGATSVHYMMVSPLSQGLFSKVILQSGSALAEWAYVPNPIEVAFSIGRRAGYRGSDRHQLLRCLKNFSATKLVKLVDKELNDQQKITPLRLVVTSPSVEFIKEGAFLPDSPERLMKLVKPLPCIWGINDLEGLILLKGIRGDVMKELRENFTLLLKNHFKIDPNLLPEKSEEVKRLYFDDKEISSSTALEFSKLTTDMLFYRTYEAVTPLIQSSTPPYMYRFRYHGQLNFILSYMKLSNIMLAIKSSLKGACHGDDIFYLFYAGFLPIYPAIRGDDLRMIEHMTSMWVNFATTGNPSTEHIKWNPTTDDDICYLDIASNPVMKKGKIGSENFEKLHQILDPVAVAF